LAWEAILTFLAGERRKKNHFFGTEMYVFVNNFVHFTFQALKLEKSPLPNMIKRFPKGFGMKIIFRISKSVEKYFQTKFFLIRRR
jgi:hypothetical protein